MKSIVDGVHVTQQPVDGSSKDIYRQIQKAQAVRYAKSVPLKHNHGLSREHRRSIAMRAYKSRAADSILREMGLSARANQHR